MTIAKLEKKKEDSIDKVANATIASQIWSHDRNMDMEDHPYEFYTVRHSKFPIASTENINRDGEFWMADRVDTNVVEILS